MATQQSTADDLVDRLAGAGRVHAKKMFGEFCVYLNDKPIALICDERVFFKPTVGGRELLGTVDEASPYPGAKLHLRLSTEQLDDLTTLRELARVTFAELPTPKKRKPKPNS